MDLLLLKTLFKIFISLLKSISFEIELLLKHFFTNSSLTSKMPLS